MRTVTIGGGEALGEAATLAGLGLVEADGVAAGVEEAGAGEPVVEGEFGDAGVTPISDETNASILPVRL